MDFKMPSFNLSFVFYSILTPKCSSLLIYFKSVFSMKKEHKLIVIPNEQFFFFKINPYSLFISVHASLDREVA